MTPRAGTVLCACGWRGHAGSGAACPSCGRPAADRVTADRLADLRRVAADSAAALVPRRRIRLIEMGLIAPAGKRPPATGRRSERPPVRPHLVTDAGLLVLRVALLAEQTRHDVAAAVARHADLEPAP